MYEYIRIMSKKFIFMYFVFGTTVLFKIFDLNNNKASTPGWFA